MIDLTDNIDRDTFWQASENIFADFWHKATVTKNLWVSEASRQIQDDKVAPSLPSLRININVIYKGWELQADFTAMVPPPATVRAFNLILAPIFLNKKREVKVREESGGKIMKCDFYFNIIEVFTSNTVLMRCNLAILIFKRWKPLKCVFKGPCKIVFTSLPPDTFYKS